MQEPTGRIRRGPRRREDEPGLRRVQIYLDERQDRALAGRAEAHRMTKSAVIRQAIDEFFTEDKRERLGLRRLASAIRAGSGRVGYLPPGNEFVEETRR